AAGRKLTVEAFEGPPLAHGVDLGVEGAHGQGTHEVRRVPDSFVVVVGLVLHQHDGEGRHGAPVKEIGPPRAKAGLGRHPAVTVGEEESLEVGHVVTYGSVIAPRSAPVTRRAYLARAPVV